MNVLFRYPEWDDCSIKASSASSSLQSTISSWRMQKSIQNLTRLWSDSSRSDDQGSLPSLSGLLVSSQEWVKNTVTNTVSDSHRPLKKSQKISENRRKSDHCVSQRKPWLLERKSDPSRKSSGCDSIGTADQIEVEYVFKTRRGSPVDNRPSTD